MEKCLIFGDSNWCKVEADVNEALEEGYKILNSFSVACQDSPYICIIMIKEVEK